MLKSRSPTSETPLSTAGMSRGSENFFLNKGSSHPRGQKSSRSNIYLAWVSPSHCVHSLVLLAKSKYRAYTDAASSLGTQASQTATSAASGSSSQATQATKSITSFISQSTQEVGRQIDDTKDYIYSTWSDNQLRKYLEDKGVIKTGTQKKREEYLALMKDNYASVADPVWGAWSESYVHDWLVDHNVIRSEEQKTYDAMKHRMKFV